MHHPVSTTVAFTANRLLDADLTRSMVACGWEVKEPTTGAQIWQVEGTHALSHVENAMTNVQLRAHAGDFLQPGRW